MANLLPFQPHDERAEERGMTSVRYACPHIPAKARTHPANHGRTVRCCDCFLKAHPEYRPILKLRFGD